MTAISETGRAELVASIADLAEEVARLAHNVEYVVAVAKARRQKCPSHSRCTSKSEPHEAECTVGLNDVIANDVVEEVVSLSPVDEPTAQSKDMTGAQSLVAIGVSDLYERLGGFLKNSLQPPHEDGRSKFG